ncbi:MAG: VWA domain-containing protein, partial [Planctomycetes bacterium]|nr:VWA domain-containing protein [Planctomycetota bacterium]
KSGSMVGRKIRLAKEAAIAAASELGSPNRVGVIAFDTEASWVVEMTDAGRRDWIADRVSRLVAGGGTNIFPALVKAHNALKDLPARIRHVILISDGYNRTLEDFQGIVTRMAASGVSLSTIGVGEQFDTRLLSSLTFWAGRERGRFDFAQDFSRIPRLVVDQTRWALGKPDAAADRQKPPDRPAEPPPPPTEPPRPDPAPEPPSEPPPPPPRVPVRVRISHPNPPFRGLSDPDVPPLFGYRRASPAAVADTLAEMPDGTPLVVSGEHGLGRVLYVGTSFDEEWGSDWRAWPRFPAWLGQAVRWIKRRPEGPLPPRVSFSRSPARGLEAEILADPGSAAPEEPPLAVWAGPDAGPPLPALRTGTHRFLVRFPEGARAAGGALKIRFPPGSGSESAEVEVPVPVEVPWESSFFEPDRDRLESIVRPAGGGILDDPARLPAPPPSLREETRAWGWLPLACAAPWLAVLVLLRRLEKRAVR